MFETDLQAGDVIFFMNTLGSVDHVAIYSGYRADTHFITHTVADPYHSIMTTRLKTADINCGYRVFRPSDVALGLQAALRMRIWSEHQVPYSQEKRVLIENLSDSMPYCHPKTGAQSQCELATANFAPNFYRYIEYASHPETPFFPSQPMEGMRCTEAIVAAFNVQQLLMIHAVKTCRELGVSWITDKMPLNYLQQHIENLPQDKKPSSAYLEYVQRSRSVDEYPFAPLTMNAQLLEHACTPSFVAWNTQIYGAIETFIQRYTFALPLDAKVTTPNALFQYMQNTPRVWQDLGTVSIAQRSYPLEQMEKNKDAWREYVKQLFAHAEEKQEGIRVSTVFGLMFQDPAIPQTPLLRRSTSMDETDLPKPLLFNFDHSQIAINPNHNLAPDTLDAVAQSTKFAPIAPFTSPERQQSLVLRSIGTMTGRRLRFGTSADD